MTAPAGSQNVCAATQVVPDARRQAGRDKKPANKAPIPLGKFCSRCGGLLVSSYTASAERDIMGKLVTLWRCVNCGDCVDGDILANRGKNPGPVLHRARPPIGPHYTGWLRRTTAITR